MLTLTEFLLARIADTTGMAREIQALAVTRGIQPDDPREPALRLARVALAECEAKRRIVEEHRPTQDGSFCGCCWLDDLGTWEPHPCPTLRFLALPFVDHPDYDESWRP